MSKQDDGGPAFPFGQVSLLDYFAINASEEDIDFWQNIGVQNDTPFSREQARYIFAERMLEQRKVYNAPSA